MVEYATKDIDEAAKLRRPANDLCLSPASFQEPQHLIDSAWQEHAPFAFWLIAALQPRKMIELGTHTGFSYLAFCQAVQSLPTPTTCYAVDTWVGDQHTGFYDEEVFASLNATNQRHYGAFSHLIRRRFDDALPLFEDKSIDLLHIDGQHTYEAVSHDFQTWRPKLSDHAVVLFHDTNERDRGFGVWRLWRELAANHPSFEFPHGHGLGVLLPGRIVPDALITLLDTDPEQQQLIRQAYERLGSLVSARYQLAAAKAELLSSESARQEAAAAQAEAMDRAAAMAPSLAALTAERARLLAHAARLQQQRDEAFAEIKTRQHEIDAAVGAQYQIRLDAALAERDAVVASTIWRATQPLRRVGDATPVPVRHAARQVLRAASGLARRRPRLPDWSSLRRPPDTAPAPQDDRANEKSYDQWVERYDTLTDADRALIRRHIGRLTARPVISVVMPAYNSSERLLREAIASVQAQLYPHWELCIADDASPTDTVVKVLQEVASTDDRIKWLRRDTNGHIAATTNSALALATGDFVALMDHDDVLPEHALYEVAVELEAHPDADLIYTDEDRIDFDGKRFQPYFKPDWNIDLMLGHNMFNHLGVFRRSLLQQIGGLREGVVDGSQDYDLVLRGAAATTPDRIRHIHAVLYHWRLAPDQSSFSQTRLDQCIAAARLAIADHLRDKGVPQAEVLPAPAAPAWNRIRWPLPDPAPKVTLIVPTRDKPALLARCASGILHRTDYPNLELLIVDNDSQDPIALDLLNRLQRDHRVRVLPYPGTFNYAAINNEAVREANGEVMVLVNSDIAVIDSGWLTEMVSLVMRPDVGAVGAKLIYGNGRIQHGGVVLGVGPPAVAGHFGYYLEGTDAGYVGQLALTRELSAVTGACLAIRKQVFQAIGGMDAENLPVSYNDVDICLRVREHGLRVIWTPFAELYHLEGASRGLDLAPEKLARAKREAAYMRRRHKDVLPNDPFYNKNFDLNDHSFELAFPPRRQKPWLRQPDR